MDNSEIAEIIKEAKPHLKDSSIKQYISSLRNLHKKATGSDILVNFEFVDNPPYILDIIKDLHITSQRNTLTAIITILDDKQKELKDIYGKKVQELNKQQTENYSKNVVSENTDFKLKNLTTKDIEDNILPVVKEKKVKKAIAPKISKKAKKTVLHTIEKVPDITKIIETDLPDLVGEDTKIDNALNHFNPIGPIDSTEEDVPFIVIEDAPVFPGCKGNKKELKMCFNKKIQKHFARKFDTDLPDELGLSSGGKSVIMLFVIDKTGNIVNIQAKAPHPKLQKEAIRIMKLLPKMKPGMQRGNPVKVTYTLPMKVVVK